MISLEVQHTDGKARAGVLSTPHGRVQTPIFMPVGTAGAVKGVTPEQLTSSGSRMILANTYHMMLRPGGRTVEELGGLHAMMGWDGPILTDSGGFQVFSLAHLRQIDDEKVVFQSHVDGSLEELTPGRCMEIQRQLGADVIMQLDECPPGDATLEHVARAVDRSILWAKECKRAWLAGGESVQSLFGIQQGGVFADLRARSAEALVELNLPGYAIGGLSVGEGHEAMVLALDAADSQFPADRPRYLMGVGEPRDILAAVQRGIDMFDCVLPTRNARNAFAFTWGGRLRLRNAQWTADPAPLDENCSCYACSNFSRGTIRHLFMAKEMLAATLLTIHNLHFFAEFMAAIRSSIASGTLESDAKQWVSQMYASRRIPGDEK
ncbi:MAG: tRNA guanosine(34) transglycosylase Tgt [Phycisphaerae bacterium]|jgi:queuine tRNA-ribosyltransferase|nr:tRNA guanosine(34) transglycosylase Tgt [Phycisphaerae bacterium]